MLALYLSVNCGAATVYDNGLPYRPDPPALATGYEMTYVLIPTLGLTVVVEADDFTLTAPARLNGVMFYDLENGAGFAGSIVWGIYSNASDAPGVLLYSGAADGVSHVSTGFVAGNYSEYVNTFTLPSITLPAGSYWLALHNGPITNDSSGHLYWEKADGAGTRPSEAEFVNLFPGSWFSNSSPNAPTAELLFQLIGVPCPSVTAVLRVNGRPQITFTTVANESYRVEYTDVLPTSTWTPVPGAEQIAGTGNTVQVTDPSQNLGIIRDRFYRAVLL